MIVASSWVIFRNGASLNMTGQLLPVQVTCIGQLGVPKPAYAQLITVHTEASVQLGTCYRCYRFGISGDAFQGLAATPSDCTWWWSSRCEQLTKCYVYKPGRTLYNSGVGHVSVLGANTSTQLTSPGHVLLDSRTAHWKASWANVCNFRSA